jgi:hypothetical protein
MSSEQRGRVRTRLQDAKRDLDAARRFAAQVHENVSAGISGESEMLRAIRVEQDAASRYRLLLDQVVRLS